MKMWHLVGYLETDSQEFLKSAHMIKNSVLKVCRVMGLKVVGEKCHIFEAPEGITYCFILSQSHFIIHTWPEECKVFFDIFTCNKEINERLLADILSKEFSGKVKRINKADY
ncbi:S-adenosylmethionine decarboxylase [Candidatus Woesearchaeota archaeon]|nr:S-adenosylmethionine decarboxylase [Candidatus Woesearchaeota archaeon]